MGQNFGEGVGEDFPRTLHLVVNSYCYAIQLWWEVPLWVSVVVPMNKLIGSEGKRFREEREVGSRERSSGGMGKDIWCAGKDDGACSVRKTRGEKKGDGDGTVEIVDGFSSFGKGIGEKGGEGVGLRENRGSIAFNGCRPVCLDAQAQGNAGLLCEGSTNLLSFGLGRALREDERCGPKSFWEAGQSSKVAVRVSDPDRVFLDEPLKKGRASDF